MSVSCFVKKEDLIKNILYDSKQSSKFVNELKLAIAVTRERISMPLSLKKYFMVKVKVVYNVNGKEDFIKYSLFGNVFRSYDNNAVTIKLYDKEILYLDNHQLLYPFHMIAIDKGRSTNVYVNLSSIYVKNLLLVWWRIWKEKGLISDALYNVYLFLVDKNNPYSEEIFSFS